MRAEAQAEADHRERATSSACAASEPISSERLVAVRRRPRAAAASADRAREPPDRAEHDRHRRRASRRARAGALERPLRERRRRDQGHAKSLPPIAGPGLGAVQRLAAEHGRDRERERRGRGRREAAAEQQVEPPPLDREADPGEHAPRSPAASMTAVSSTRRSCGSVLACCGGWGRRRRAPAQRRAARSAAPRPRARPGSVFVFAPHTLLVGRRRAADKALTCGS